MRAEHHRLGRLLAWLLLPALALAAPPTLDPALRELLAPWLARWDSLDAGARARLQGNARRWLALDEAGRIDFLARVAAWEALPPAERARRREAYAAWRSLEAGERAAVAAAAARYAAATPERQAAWREAFDALDLDVRRAWLLGPEAGRDFIRLRPLFAFVPPEEHAATQALLRSLTPAAREDLIVLLRRLPPAEWDALRRELVALPETQRAARLRARLAD
ncbi:DUF3106 domain-containing protein [Rehaibacterium terrae]|jgi:hypothetical protein|uniref:DUF3106 domain-containing protein n=1 Tax=Rehaibacterium terrae TaxID=1341696 RepID=A0A7W7V7U5_9GAMM|nr:DUF3106 domain-containing protein [Rehaibacterium terrae]MBB5014743.1 hypothetical protein [Rehaibacterium terrae]